MRSKWFGLFGIILALMLMAGPLAGSAMAASDNGAPQAGHDMSTMDSSGQQNSEHDMSNMERSNENGASADTSGGGRGESAGDTNTPPDWPVIYGFGFFNLLVIIAAAFMKNKGVNGVN